MNDDIKSKLEKIYESCERRAKTLPVYEYPSQVTVAEFNFLILQHIMGHLMSISKLLIEHFEELELAGKLDDTTDEPAAPKKRGRKKKSTS